MWKKVNQQKRKQRRVIEQRIYKYTCVARLHVPYNIEYKKTIYRQFIFIIYLGYIYVYTLGILFDLFLLYNLFYKYYFCNTKNSEFVYFFIIPISTTHLPYPNQLHPFHHAFDSSTTTSKPNLQLDR